MARDWIAVGDITSSGGRVISGSPFIDIDGKPVARENDMATCPRHKGVFPIKSGCDATMIIDGKPAALHGARLFCGCTVLAVQQHHVFSEYGSGDSGLREDAGQMAKAAAAAAIAAETTTEFNDRFKVELEDGSPAAGYRYELRREDGSTVEGVTDAEGMIPLLSSDRGEDIEICVFAPEASRSDANA